MGTSCERKNQAGCSDAMFESSLREIKMISGNEYSTLSAGINFGSEASLQLPVELGMASRYEGRSQSGFGKV